MVLINLCPLFNFRVPIAVRKIKSGSRSYKRKEKKNLEMYLPAGFSGPQKESKHLTGDSRAPFLANQVGQLTVFSSDFPEAWDRAKRGVLGIRQHLG